jgi:protease-4
MSDSQPTRAWGGGVILLFIILPLIAGVLLSLLVPKPVIGVIYLKDAIYDQSAQDMLTQIIYAREHSEIKAVVLVVNSPGGTVVDTESVYLELERLRQTKPVVTMVEGMAASGAYYLAAGTDYIFAKPSSQVGNVGVIGYAPSTPTVFEEVYSTGPYKLWGTPRDTFLRDIDVLKQGFYNAVQLGRGSRLKAGPDVILRGEIWQGTTALTLGLIDELGEQSLAFDKAAQLSHVAHYKVANLHQLAGISEVIAAPFFVTAPNGLITAYPNKAGVYFLYVPTEEK